MLNKALHILFFICMLHILIAVAHARQNPPESGSGSVIPAPENREKEPSQGSQAGTSAKTQNPLQLSGIQIGGLWYISYQAGDAYKLTPGATETYSQFRIKRGYINFQAALQPWMDVRVTPDVTQDQTGDVKVRLKYLYAKLKGRGMGLIQKPYVEFGMAHMPWLDFEEHVNRFRMQDTMFMERNGLFNSADIGFTFGSNFGPDLPAEYRNNVNSSYAGRYGSWQFGVYNGGGYHAAEKNNNKVVEARGSLRPLPDLVPGFQLSLFGVHGKANLPQPDPPSVIPDYDVLAGMASFEHQYFVVAGQWYSGEGNASGSALQADGGPRPQSGQSYFGEVRPTEKRNLSLIARHDRFSTERDAPQSDLQKRWILGFAWQMFRNNYWVVDYERLSHRLPEIPAEDRFQVTLQISF